MPEIIGDDSCAPYFLSNRIFYGSHDDISAGIQDELNSQNLTEWMKFFEQKIPKDKLSQLIYKTKLPAVDDLIFALKGQTAHVNAGNRELVKLLGQQKDLSLKALYYLGFAKRCEPFATADLGKEAWELGENSEGKSHGPSPDNASEKAINALIDGVPKVTAHLDNKFLQARYDFQVLRLLFYGKQYARASSFYQEHGASFADAGSMTYRAMEIAAGSLYRQKQYAKANYLFSVIYRKYPPLSRRSYLSFHPLEQQDWNQSLEMAQTKQEKLALWELFGIYADGFEAIRRIYELDPKAGALALLLVREVNKAEMGFKWGTVSRDGDGEGPRRKPVSDADLKLLQTIIDAQKVDKIAVWNLALGHLYALAGLTQAAEAHFAKAEQKAGGNPVVLSQIRMSRFFNVVNSLKTPSASDEDRLASDLRWLNEQKGERAGFELRWSFAKLAQIYTQRGDAVRAQFLSNLAPRAVYESNARLDELLKFRNQQKPSRFDALLIERYFLDGKLIAEFEGVNELRAENFAGAVEDFKNASSQEKLSADPFVIHINDCHDCDFAALKVKKYTKLSFAQRLFQLSQQAKQSGEAGARASFELANGLYNMTYYGNGREIYDVSTAGKGSKGWPRDYSIMGEDRAGFGSPQAFGVVDGKRRDVAPALKYYQRAIELSQDNEFKAKATFMAAKCEQAQFINTLKSEDDFAIHSGKYFRSLQNSFAGTKYYQEIIKECGYFKTFLGRK